MFIRFRNAVLSLVLILTFFTLFSTGVQASGDPIVLGEINRISLDGGQSAAFSFIPQESGEYVFWITNRDVMHNISWKVSPEGQDFGLERVFSRQENYEAAALVLEAGKKYDIKLLADDGASTREFGIAKREAAESIAFPFEHKTTYPGRQESLRLILDSPAALPGECTFTSSDPSVATVTADSTTSAKVQYLSPGTVTITASNGVLTCSCTITVLVPGELYEGSTYYMAEPTEGIYDFLFTPTESGRYLIYANDDAVNSVEGVFPEYHWFRDGSWKGVSCDLEAGRTYKLIILITKLTEEFRIGKLAINIIRAEGAIQEPGSCNLGDFREIAQNTDSGLVVLEIGASSTLSSGGTYYKGSFYIEESGIYRLYVSGEKQQEWTLKCDGSVTEGLDEAHTPDGGYERFYSLSAGQIYDLICDSAEGFDHTVLLEKFTPELPEGSPPITGDKPVVEDRFFTTAAGMLPEGSTLRVCSSSQPNMLSLERSALKIAAERGLTLEAAFPGGIITLDAAMMDTVWQNLQGDYISISAEERALAELPTDQKDALADYETRKILSLRIEDGSETLHDFSGSHVSVYIPMALSPDEAWKVIHIADNGDTAQMEAEPRQDGIVFYTDHFSVFAVVQSKQAPAPTEPEVSPTAPEIPEPSGPDHAALPDGIGSPWMWAVAGAAILLVFGVILIVRKKH